MQAFILERLCESGWKLEGPVYWTLDQAIKTAGRMIRQRAAKQVRIRVVTVATVPISEIPETRVSEVPRG